MSEFFNSKEDIRKKVIGLGDTSTRKTYYPQLQERIDELVEQKILLEQKNSELQNANIELNKTQELLIANEIKYRTLFESANDAVFLLHGITYELINCNNKAINLLGYSNKKEILLKHISEFYPLLQPSGKSSKEIAISLISKALNGYSQVVEWEVQKKDNSKIFCVVSFNSIEISGEKLVQIIVRDVTKTKKLEQKLGMATISTEEKERKRFAKELHDGIGPILSTIKLYLEWLKEENEIEQHNTIIDKANQSIIEATKAIKEISYNLSPHVLANYGLLAAINQYVENIKLIEPVNIDVNFRVESRLNEDIEIMFYRIVSELLNNTVKYANSSSVVIILERIENSVKFKYIDNGIGFNIEKMMNADVGMGLYNIKNRVQKIGGTVEFISETNAGLTVEIFINDINP